MKRKIHDYSKFPWNIPCYVQRSGFQALKKGHSCFNVEVNLGAHGPYGITKKDIDPRQLLFSDLQIDLYNSKAGRLGSGRSGFYRGKYLKGIGRTMLAGNWCDPKDTYHNTGHQSASSAVREYLVSEYLIAKNCEGAINKCEGILAKPISEKLGSFFESAFPRRPERNYYPNIDRHVQTITVKGTNFKRISNFVWLLNSIGIGNNPALSLNYFFTLLSEELLNQRSFNNEFPEPYILASKLSETFFAGLDNFRTLFRAGVNMMSIFNNYSLDGRFLDLETPVIIGRPFIGFLSRRNDRRYSQILGFEALMYRHYFKQFITFMFYRLGFIFEQGLSIYTLREQKYAKGFLAELKRVFKKTHPVYSDSAMEHWLFEMFKQEMDLTSIQKNRLKAFDLEIFRRYGAVPDIRVEGFSGKPIKLKLANVEAPLQGVATSVPFLDTDLSDFSDGCLINEIIREADSKTDCEQLFEHLKKSSESIRNAVSPLQ